MKKLVPLFAALLLVCACDGFRTSTYQDEIVMALDGSPNDSLFYKLSLEYVSAGMLIPAMEKMNAAIVMQAFDLDHMNGTMEEIASTYRENLIDEYITENGDLAGTMPVLTWEDSITGEFSSTYKNWRNYTITYYCYRGGAHGFTTFNQIVFDRKTGDVLKETDIFADGYAQPVAELMRARVKADLEAEDPEILDFLEMDYVQPNTNFSVSSAGVQWIFQPDDILPHAFGMLSVTVPWEDLKPYLK